MHPMRKGRAFVCIYMRISHAQRVKNKLISVILDNEVVSSYSELYEEGEIDILTVPVPPIPILRD